LPPVPANRRSTVKHLSDQRAPRKSSPLPDASPDDVANLILQELYEAYVTEAKLTITIHTDNTSAARLDIEAETTHAADGVS
jgi:hypothetical protein